MINVKIVQEHKLILFFTAIICYIGLITYSIYTYDQRIQIVSLAIPCILTFLYIIFLNFRNAIFLILILIPLSLKVHPFETGLTVIFPSEPVTGLVALFTLFYIIKNKFISWKAFTHPISLSIFCFVLWEIVASSTSAYPLVSIKQVIVRIVYFLVFYFLVIKYVNSIKAIRTFFWCYALALIPVIIYSLYNHSLIHFIQEGNDRVMKPFYQDHTIYGACIAILICYFVGQLFLKKPFRKVSRILIVALLVLLCIAAFFSYSRAVWLSLFVGLVAAIWFALKIRMKWVLMFFFLSMVLIKLEWHNVVLLFEYNRNESSTDVSEHIKSIAGIKDPSNAERLVRWKAALRMFEERPIFGFGPGTFQFVYASFEHPFEMTRISTTHGNMGGAHSEYLTPLSESGLPGLFLFVMIIFFIFKAGIDLSYFSSNHTIRIVALSLTTGLVTYFLHGFVNYFTDTDKAAILVWGIAGIFVGLQLNQKSV